MHGRGQGVLGHHPNVLGCHFRQGHFMCSTILCSQIKLEVTNVNTVSEVSQKTEYNSQLAFCRALPLGSNS